MSKLLDSPWFYAVAMALLIAAFFHTQFRWEIAPKPVGGPAEMAALPERDHLNVLFVVIDTLRADHLSAYGYERKTSPTLDALAERGIRFEHVEAQSSWTKTSMASLWTSLYPGSTGVWRSEHSVPEEATLVSEIFHDAGYRTTGIWRNGWVATNFGFDQGYDTYVKPVPSNVPGLKRSSPGTKPLEGTDHDLTESARSFIHSFADTPFFLYLHYMDAHQYTYDGASDLFGTRYVDAYDNAIHWVDSNIAKLVETLRNLGILDKTILFIVTDHGEAFSEHGTEGHAKNLYVEVQRVPWIISLPFDLEEPVVVRNQVANIDIAPTLLEMVGLPPMPKAQGLSQWETIQMIARGEAEPPGRVVFSELDRFWGKPQRAFNHFVAMVDPPYRLHHRIEHGANTAELYDHSQDPGEANDIAGQERERVAAMLQEVKSFVEERELAWGEPEEIELDEMMLNQLRALGYAVEK